MKKPLVVASLLASWYLITPPWLQVGKFDSQASLSKWDKIAYYQSSALLRSRQAGNDRISRRHTRIPQVPLGRPMRLGDVPVSSRNSRKIDAIFGMHRSKTRCRA